MKSYPRGSNDSGKVHIQIEHEEKIFYGLGINADIVTASVEVFIDAFYKI